ncbi:programmed cell death protein 2-like [Bombina bombina]|uniref:programmed cell death protein 2-like n=1 Tax=Bombina bombina TaxID=8345 RepID=UPI00235B24B3|nr:programmed cell death protein 2-like [Bombina bombina]
MAQAPPIVLLGFKDAVLEDGESSWHDSKIGGLPDILPDVNFLYPSCPLCSAFLCHVVQVYCPLEGSLCHRVIHVFACYNKACWGKQESWVILRSQSLQVQDKIKESLVPQEGSLAANDWCADADDWGFDSSDSLGATPSPHVTPQATSCEVEASHVPCTSLLQNLSLNERSWVVDVAKAMFRSYYVAVEIEEDFASSVDLDHALHLLHEYEKCETVLQDDPERCSVTKGDNEKYEKNDFKSKDLVFHKFLKKISPCKNQILRYSWNGTPLYMSQTALGSGPPPCTQCGGHRVFEFQLMPALVSMLHSTRGDVALEFGTVLIFTCASSCWSDGEHVPVHEFCLVQEDPDQHFFK